jgi:Pectate lyase superfamily protein/Right handed beta helix region
MEGLQLMGPAIGAAGEAGKVLAADDPAVARNVKSLGAKGDGATDDSTVINSVITALATEGGGVLYFPPGTYLVKANVAMKSKVSLIGSGTGATTIKAAAGVTTAPLVGTSGNAIEDVLIRDLTVDGNASAFATNIYGINVTKGSRVRITNVRVKNTYHIGIYSTECTDFSVDNCSLANIALTSASPNCIHVLKGTRAKVAFNTVADWGNGTNGRAIYVAESPGTEIVGNNISKPGNVDDSHSISLDASSHRCIVSENILDNAGYTGESRRTVGISVINCNDTLISSNRILEPAQDKGSLECIQIDGTSARATVTGNHCEYGDDNGITAWGAGEHVVTGNFVMFCAHHGISVNGNNCAVSGNVVKNSGQHPAIPNTSGIGILSGVTGTVVTGNRCYDDQGVKTQVYGLFETGTADKNTILGNDFAGNKEGPISYVGANSVVGANQGVTPRKGEVEVHDIGATGFSDSVALNGSVTAPPNGTLLYRSDVGQLAYRTAANGYTQLAKDRVFTLTDGATVAPSFLTGNHFILEAKGSRTIANVNQRVAGATVTFDIKNGTGGAITTTWNEAYKLAGAWVDPAAGKSRTVTFYCYDGTNWRELGRAAADI